MTQPDLRIRDLHVAVDGKAIIQGLDLQIKGGEVHAIMGPNGTGKSTLSQALMGHPRYEVTRGSVLLDGQDLLAMAVDERARAGLFLAMQYPSEIPGVSNANFIRLAVNSRLGPGKELPVLKFHRQLQQKMEELSMDASFADRYLNEGFSGGEKKRNEILQMAMLKPRIAILDEIDSGLDIDALKVVAKAVNDMRSPEMGVLIITHYQRLLQYIEPDVVHVLMDGKIVRSGGKEVAAQLEHYGYDWLKTVDVQMAEVQTADMQSTDMQSTDMQSTDMQSTDMQSTDMHSSDMQSTDMHSSDEKTADVQSTVVQPSDVQPAPPEGTDAP